MKLLILGGTRFLGRHLVDAALARGYEVATFTRGRSPAVNPSAEALTGDRDPNVGAGLAALASRRFDAAIDLSGYVPRVVGAAATLLESAIGRYLFVSSVSAYRDLSRPGTTEAAPLAGLTDPASEELPRDYGALKAACERVVERHYGSRATLVRPGLIVGPYDATDRFGYWVARFVHPHLLGERAPRAVVPAPPAFALQVIDARDLAAWLVTLIEHDVAGTFNAIGRDGDCTMGSLVEALRAAAGPGAPEPAWIDEALLLAQGVEPWVGLPLWIPATEADHAGFMRIDTARADAAGLRCRPLASTIADTAAWLAERDNSGVWRMVLSAAGERAILQAAGITL